MKVAVSIGYMETVYNRHIQYAQNNQYCFQNI